MKIITNEYCDPEFNEISNGTVIFYRGKIFIKICSDDHNVVDLETGVAGCIEYYEKVQILDCELKINTKIER